MENFAAILIPMALLGVLLRLLTLPIRWSLKIFVNSACGFGCLWLLNSVSGFTGLYFPVNFITACVAGFLGIPGIGLLAILQRIL